MVTRKNSKYKQASRRDKCTSLETTVQENKGKSGYLESLTCKPSCSQEGPCDTEPAISHIVWGL